MGQVGRPAKKPRIGEIRELTREEALTTARSRAPSVKRFRDSHHMVARLFAMGLRPGQVANASGYSLPRVSVLYADPAFQELIASYRNDVNGSWKEEANDYFALANKGRSMSMRMIVDQLEKAEEVGEDLPLRTLLAVQSDLADRTGYPKRTEAINYNLDFAARLDNAIKITEQTKQPRIIDVTPSDSLPSQRMRR